MNTLKLERTFLAKYLPDDILTVENKEIVDIYLPDSSAHPKLRLRKNGAIYELTKKAPIREGDPSSMMESTIILDDDEFSAISKLSGKFVSKKRYFYLFGTKMLEIDLFEGDLKGLVLIDVEFYTDAEKNAYDVPDICLADVTDEESIAGGKLAGKSYADIEGRLNELGYKAIDY